ncbi:leucine-rich repeat-containing protein 74A-like [Ruditapes philippinarum]|uniref:leucine-rich repeat-containing protein 74A-like n=1 Tax=Ruditapes philippinarum TaxID=129788 RepID=UPI00295AF42A|nr:leucine-rich repeat-containing protein 74A-like [Ruditapes philippinarum]
MDTKLVNMCVSNRDNNSKTVKMVLVNKSKTLDLAGLPPDEPDPGLPDDLRIQVISATVQKMEENEKVFFSKRDTFSSSLMSKSGSLPVTPRSSRPCSKHDTGINRTIQNSEVALNHKNSAISRSYSSPRQYTLSASRGYRSANGIVDNLRPSTRSNLLSRDASYFDYDVNEDVPLESLRTYKPRKIRVVQTDDIYVRACSFLGITASQTYIKQVTTTREVCMANTSLSYLTIKPIAISLVRDYYIQVLDVSGNDLGPLGVMYLSEMLVMNDSIIELNISNTNPGRPGLEALAKNLPQNKTLTILRLESNSLDHTETDFLVQIMKNAPTITELYLGHNNLGYEGAKLLAQELEENTTLRTLDLQWNHFRKQSASQLCNAIKMNKGLHMLNLSWNGLGKEGCIALARSLPKNTSLQNLDLTNNRIDVVALPFLLHGLVRNTSIQSLNLSKNPMTTEGAKAVVRAITGAPKLNIKYLNIDDIPVDKDFTRLVKKLQEKKYITVEHGVEMYSAIELEMKEHDPHDLNRFDPVMVIIEYMRIDNLRLIDMFGYLDIDGRGLVSRDNLRQGVATLGLPLTEYHLDCIMHDIDSKKDGYLDLEEFMVAQRDMSKVIIQRTTKAKKKGKEDQGLKELRKILKELVEKRNKRNKEKAQSKMNSAFTGAVNKVKAINKEEKRRASIISAGESNSSTETNDQNNLGKSVSLANILQSSDKLSTLQLPSLQREDTFDIETLPLHELESNEDGFKTSRAQFDNFVMETVRETTETNFGNEISFVV